MKTLFDKLKLTGSQEIKKSEGSIKEPLSTTENVEIPEMSAQEIKVEKNIDTNTKSAKSNDPELARKESLLVSNDEIEAKAFIQKTN